MWIATGTIYGGTYCTNGKMHRLTRLLSNDYFILARFLVPLAFTTVVVDIGEQFLNRSISRTADVVDTLAAFGLAYVFVKFFVGVLGELKHAGLVQVQDRSGFHRILVFAVTLATSVSVFLIIIAKTQLGVWLIEDLHGVSSEVSALTHTALSYLSIYPMIDAVSWYHGGVLLQWRHSTLVGAASLADIMAQIFSVAILLYTPLVCTKPIVVPILAAYGGVITRCTIILIGFYRMVYPKLQKERISKVTFWKVVAFVCPLMMVLSVQRISRPMINLLVARFSPTKCLAAESVAVLTASYPLGHLPYGWLNQLRPVSPTFQKKSLDSSRRVIAGKKIGIFTVGCLIFSATVSLSLFWIPGVSVAILEHAVGIPHELALLCVNPLRIFSFFCFAVSVRASLTGWLTLHHQTKLVAPSALLRAAAILASFFVLSHYGVTGALKGVLALFLGFFSEMVVVPIFAAAFVCWRYWRAKRRSSSERLEPEEHGEVLEMESVAQKPVQDFENGTQYRYDGNTDYL